ncbi:MAG: chloride channel protein [Planctomycetaceae bacterium]|nr:chloride channel protein [Planctomycetaceae bacterium]
MSVHESVTDATTGGLPLSPILSTEVNQEFASPPVRSFDRRVVWIAALAAVLGVLATFASQILLALINFVTNLCFFGRLSLADASPADNRLGLFVIFLPAAGGALVGLMARYGSKAIRGHGIPEAMEQVLTNESRIPARITLLKPLSAAISIGTGGPFGAEGPIIATGGALGSLCGQVLSVTGAERKALLAAGAAAGMTATFGTPIAAVLLAIELLLFEYRAQSFIPVAAGTFVAAVGHNLAEGSEAIFAMPAVAAPGVAGLAAFVVFGGLLGLLSVGITRAVYAIEDAFEHLPIHWMWWPVVGGSAVGAVGVWAPRTLGVGYDNLRDLLHGSLALHALAVLGLWKFVSWSISLGSGTSGGTLAPLLTIGGCCGALLAAGISAVAPAAAVDARLAALVGMAALFAGASRAPLASALFAFEVTREAASILPLLAGCTMSYLVSCLAMRNSIMTEKIARRGVPTPTEYVADTLDRMLVRDLATKDVVVLQADDTLAKVRAWFEAATPESRHQGYPVVNAGGHLVGVVTRKDFAGQNCGETPVGRLLARPPVVVYEDCSARDAAEHLVRHDIGRLPVVSRQSKRLTGFLTRSDLLSAYARRLREHQRT